MGDDKRRCDWCGHPALFHDPNGGCDWEVRRNYFDPRLSMACSCSHFQEAKP